MKRVLRTTASIAAVFVLVIAAHAGERWKETFPEAEDETVRRSLNFSNPAGTKLLAIDNLEGSIQVTGYDGAAVELEVSKTIQAQSWDDLALAKREVELQIDEKDNRIEVFVEGPFRSRDRGRRWYGRSYRVNYDFRVKVPRDCDLYLRTVNDGDIRVDAVNGKYDIENVTRIVLNEVSGAGRARTINGGVNVTFNRSPSDDCSFGTLNGDVDVAFPRDFSADCWFKTFNGDAYTNFELQPLPHAVARSSRRDGKIVYRNRSPFGGRIGKGGPQMNFDTFNGDIHVISR